ncbi:MAG: chromate resistance protein ChrB domain-containing protein [Chloroflexota bacterium]
MRFVDSRAEFLYVSPVQVMAVAEREGATPFDVPGVELVQKSGCSSGTTGRSIPFTRS